jgi:hypothetical protein
MDFDQLFLEHVAASYDKQMALGELVGKNNWQFDMASGTLAFGTKFTFKIQMIGTESTHSNTWLWAWANEASAIPRSMLRAAEELRAFGEKNGLSELTQPGFPLSQRINGHVFSMIASGVCHGDAYYRGPYEGGALFMLIRDERYPHIAHNPQTRISTLFPQLIASLPIPNHRLALRHYLESYLAKIDEQGDTITANFGKNKILKARFLPDNRLAEISGQLSP